jgi:predicted DCC family thiol-disulfide oxidoreductase YuxK
VSPLTDPPRAVRVEPGGPPLPLVIWDGDCGFCRAWVDYWKRLTGERVSYAPYQEVGERFPEVRREDFAAAVKLVTSDGQMYSGAHAAYVTLDLGAGKWWCRWAYEHVPGFAPVSEAVYRGIAAHRSLAYKITKLLWGIPVEPDTQAAVTQLFLRILGLIYLIAFVSFGVQAAGLIGANGIRPIAGTIHGLGESYGDIRYRIFPTLFWLKTSDAAIRGVWLAGCGFAILMMLGLARRLAALGALALYLSLVTAGLVFMNFQWDALLLEAGFLAIFAGRSRAVVWLYRWLLFRLMFMSGAVKLLSADPHWRNLTALTYHYQTQPLPTPVAWYMNQLPVWFQKASCVGMFFVELVVPFLIFAPRRLRFVAAGLITAFEVLIFLTGNYTYFNLLTIALCLFLLDDARLARALPKRFLESARRFAGRRVRLVPLRKAVIAVVATALLLVSVNETAASFGVAWAPALRLGELLGPLRIVNTYGLFAVMTTSRPEIVLEGSNDGVTWQEYQFKYKPGDVRRPPRWVAPYQPRLDWQMWFAALGSYRDNPWIVHFIFRLLQGSPDVLALLDGNPFPGAPPRYVRAQLYEYRFTTWEERRQTGAWWQRRLLGGYLPAVTLRNFLLGPPR